MITNKQSKLLAGTWLNIAYQLSIIDWTSYGDRLLELCIEESKSHDRFRADSIRRGLSIQQEARYFAIKRMWEYMNSEKAPSPSDYLMLQRSCFAAYCIATNPRFNDARSNFNVAAMEEIASWDYCDLIREEQDSPTISPSNG